MINIYIYIYIYIYYSHGPKHIQWLISWIPYSMSQETNWCSVMPKQQRSQDDPNHHYHHYDHNTTNHHYDHNTTNHHYDGPDLSIYVLGPHLRRAHFGSVASGVNGQACIWVQFLEKDVGSDPPILIPFRRQQPLSQLAHHFWLAAKLMPLLFPHDQEVPRERIAIFWRALDVIVEDVNGKLTVKDRHGLLLYTYYIYICIYSIYICIYRTQQGQLGSQPVMNSIAPHRVLSVALLLFSCTDELHWRDQWP